MEYLGAKIDIDTSDFEAKMNRLARVAERTAETADEQFRKVYKSFKDNLDKVGTVPFDESITELRTNVESLNKEFSRLGTAAGSDGMRALKSIDEIEKQCANSIQKNTDEIVKQNVEISNQSIATMELSENMQSLSVVAEKLGESKNGGIRELGEDIKALLEDVSKGKVDISDASEQIDIMSENAKRFSAQNLGKEDKERIRMLSSELNIVIKRLKSMKSIEKNKGDDDGLSKGIMKGMNSLARYVSTYLPSQFRKAFVAISRVISSSGVILAISAVMSAVKKLYDWNEKLIKQKWGKLKDNISIIFGLSSAEEYASEKIRKNTEEINKNTKALFDNVKAQRAANTALGKANIAMDRGELEKTLNEEFGEREWSWLGEGKSKKIKLNGEENQRAIDRYINLSPTEIEQLTMEELERMQQDVKDALLKSDQLGKLEDAEKKYQRAVEDYKKVKGKGIKHNGTPLEEILGVQMANYKKIYDFEKEAYDKIEEAIGLREKTITRLNELRNKDYFERKNNDNRESIDRMEIDTLGTPVWADYQSNVDNATTALKRFNDERGYQLGLIEKEADRRKSNAEAADSEFKSLENLKIEYNEIISKIRYLSNNGVNSAEQNDMISQLKQQAAVKVVQIENELTSKNVTLLERTADLKKRCNELDAQKDFNIRTIEIEIEKTNEHIRLMESEKNISDKEKAAIEELNMRLEELYGTKDKLIHQNWLSEQEHELELINTRIEREKVELDTLRKKGLIDDENYDVQSRNLDAKSLESRMDALEAEKARLKAKKEECELTYEEQQRYESIGEQIDYIGSQIENVLTKDISKMNDNLNATNIKAEKLRDTFGAIADAMYGMADAAGNNLGDNSFSNVANGLGKVGETMASMDWESMKNYSSKKNGGQGGKVNYAAIAQAAEFVADQTTKIIASQRRIRESARQWKEELEDVAHQYALMQIEKIKYEKSNSFGVDDPYEQMAVTAEKYNEARKKTMESLQKIEEEGQIKIGQKKKIDWSNVVKDSLAGAAAGAAVGSMAGPYGAAIGAAAGLVTGLVTGIFASREVVDVMSSLRDQFGDIFDPETLEIKDEILASYDKLDDRTKKLVDNYKELKEQMDEAKKEYVEFATDMFGDIGKTLADQLAEAFRNGDVYDAVGDFKDYVKKQMENLISQQLYKKLFGGIFDRITKNIEDSNERGSIDFIGEMSALPAEVERLAGQYSYYLEQVRDAMGGNWDLFSQNEQSQDAMKGTIASMSEETAGKINGNFMGLKLTAMEINEGVSSIRGINEEANAILSRSYNVMQRIEANTAMLHDIAQDVGRMRLEGVRAL